MDEIQSLTTVATVQSSAALAHNFTSSTEKPSLPKSGLSHRGLEGWPIVTFSHFLPRPELHRGYRTLEHIEGSLQLGEQLAALHTAAGKVAKRPGAAAPHVHVFGHTHFSLDEVLGGVRYVQHPLGNPQERRNGWQISTSDRNPFALVWSRHTMEGSRRQYSN